jgi:hypothetical protein
MLLASVPAKAGYSLFASEPAECLKPELRRIFGPLSPSLHYDRRMLEAAEIAAARAASSSTYNCWRYVKTALLNAHVIDHYPKTQFAKEAAGELQFEFGFRKLPISDPYQAPRGAVLVYGGAGPGHIEIRTAQGFVSDFISSKPSPLPLIGIYVKPQS